MVLLAGCVRHDITIGDLATIRAHADLAADPGATIELADSDGSARTFRGSDHVDLVDLRGVHHAITIGDLAGSCWAAGGPCDQGIDRVVVDHDHRLSSGGEAAVYTTLVVGAIAGAFACGIACDSPTSYIVGGGVAVVGVVVLAGLWMYGKGISSLHN